MARSNGCCNSVIPTNAARPFSRYAAILDRPRVRQILSERAGGHVLEIGAGCLRNALYLQSRGYSVSILEVRGIEERFPEQYRRFRQSGGQVLFSLSTGVVYDIALATFVFETICRPQHRNALLRTIFGHLRPDSPLITSTRGPADLVTAHASGVPCSDGFLTPARTFSRSFTRAQFSRLLSRAGFCKVEFLHGSKTVAPEYLYAIAWAGTSGD